MSDNPHFQCPITFEVMEDPVVDHEGNSYEKSAIEEWIRTKGTSPITSIKNAIVEAQKSPEAVSCGEPTNAPQEETSETELIQPQIPPIPPQSSFVVGQEIDVLDTQGIWSEGKILRIDSQTGFVHITYLFWEDKWNETIEDIQKRIAPIYTHTYLPEKGLKAGQRISIHAPNDQWKTGFVVESQRNQTKIRYFKHEHPEEWIAHEVVPFRIRQYGRDKLLDKQCLKSFLKWKVPVSHMRRSLLKRERSSPFRDLLPSDILSEEDMLHAALIESINAQPEEEDEDSLLLRAIQESLR